MVFIESSSMTILEQRFLMGPMRPIGGLHEAGDNGPSSHETAAREHHPSTKHVEYTHGNIAVFVALRISFSPGCVGGAEHHHARKTQPNSVVVASIGNRRCFQREDNC